jgi:hypothetical protein
MGFFSRLLGRIGGAGKAQSGSSEVFRRVGAYVAALSEPRAAVADVSRLPYPKPRIKEALIAAIGLAREENMRAELKAAYVRLADWQEDLPTLTESSGVSSDDTADSLGGARQAGEMKPSVTKMSARVAAEARMLSDELKSLGL